jgi:hypothetical protein
MSPHDDICTILRSAFLDACKHRTLLEVYIAAYWLLCEMEAALSDEQREQIEAFVEGREARAGFNL